MSKPLRPSSGQALPRRTVTFIVRLWAEYLEQTPPTWRGEIKHVGSEEVMYFGDMNKMLKSIEILTGKPKEGREG